MEIWKDIEDYPDYKVSNLGRVMSYKGKVPCILKEHLVSKGYQQFRLFRDKNPPIKRTLRAHRLVAQAFIPNPENKSEVNHLNGIKTDNKVKNLEWCTRLENQSHACQMGYYLHKLAPEEVREIRASKETHKVLGKKYKVSRSWVSQIKRGESRIHD